MLRERNQKCHLLSPIISKLALPPALNLLKWGKGPDVELGEAARGCTGLHEAARG
jgi:hypothetical protein